MSDERRAEPAGFITEAMETLRERIAAGRRMRSEVVWLDHYALLPGDDTVQVTHASTSSGVGGGLSALVIRSTTTGEVDGMGGNKVVHMAVQVPPGHSVVGVRLGYELTDPRSHISQIRLSQVQDPPKTALVLLDDGTDHTDVGPIYVDSTETSIDPSEGPLILSLRVNFGNTADRIAVRGVGLHLRRR